MPTDAVKEQVLEPVTDGFDPDTAARVRMTVSCRDTDALPKVEGAGSVRLSGDTPVQVMHNGVLVEEGCYFGPWMDEIIRCLRGHHEPQEEVVFDAVVRRLRDTVGPERTPVAVELGSFWAYYSLWFLHELPHGRTFGIEPDPAFLEVGRRNFALNGREGVFVPGAIGPEPGATLSFETLSTGETVAVPQYDLRAVLEAAEAEHVDLLLSDIQGAEIELLRGGLPLLREGRVRFLVLSTHHHSISGSATTHQDCLELLREAGAHVVAEHTVGESYSGDGLIVAAFDPADADLVVQVSHARYSESLFGSLEPELEQARAEAVAARADVVARSDVERTGRLDAEARAARAEQELQALRATRLLRWSSPLRAVYGRVRATLARLGSARG